jgi:hypothetical protein
VGLGIITGVIAIAGCDRVERFAVTPKNLDGLVQAFIQTPPYDIETVERVFGLEFLLTSTRWDRRYIAENVELGDVTIEQAEYDILQGGASPNWLLVLTLGGQCVSTTEFMQRNKDKNLVPGQGSSDGPDPLIELDEHLPWGVLAFEFRVSTGCLNYISMYSKKA